MFADTNGQIYIEWAEMRLKDEEIVTVYSNNNGSFGFRCMKYYSGLMAKSNFKNAKKQYIARPKQGLFDIKVLTGNRYNNDQICHRNIIEDVINHSSVENCLSIWRGQEPETVTDNQTEIEILYSLALLFFEQEINWGREEWQRTSNFNPSYDDPFYVRPRDMLMGFICQAYELGVDNIVSWDRTGRSTTFYYPHENTKWKSGWGSYPNRLKKYFTGLRHDEHASALMADERIRDKYRSVANEAPINPGYLDRQLAGNRR